MLLTNSQTLQRQVDFASLHIIIIFVQDPTNGPEGMILLRCCHMYRISLNLSAG